MTPTSPPPAPGAADAEAAPFTGIRLVQRTQQVRQQLEEAIASGHYRPGDKLPSERQLVETFGVSRLTVREAIRSLEALGLVVVQHGRGCFVTDLVDEKQPFGHWLSVHHRALHELLKIRGALDALAAQSAAERRNPAEVAAVEAACTAFADAAADDATPAEQLVELDIAFHRSVAEASGSPLLCRLLDDLSRYLGESRRLVLSPPGRPARSAEEHAQILGAIAAGDGAGAEAAVHRHIDAVIAVLAEIDELSKD